MRTYVFVLVSVLFATGAMAESHPSWWTIAPVDATSIVGIEWQNLKNSPFSDAVAAELTSSIGLPELPCLAGARQILLASPQILAIINGDFSPAALRAQTGKLGMKPASYHGVSLWISSGPALSIAQLSEQLLIAGSRATLEAAIDRSLAERRHYSPLLSRGARYAQADLWVVADRLPDPLASIFVPIEGNTLGFDGYVTTGDGLRIEATIDAGSDENAAVLAEGVRQSIPSLPGIAQGLTVRVDARDVFLSLDIDEAEFIAGLRGSSAPVPSTLVPPPSAVAPPAPLPIAVVPPSVVPPPPEAAKPIGPQVVRIVGLEEGPREIVLPPPSKPDKP